MGISSFDQGTRDLEGKVAEFGVRTVFDRFLDSQPECQTGSARLCCNFCSMGPCRLTKPGARSVCGIDKHTVVLWNYARNITAGVGQHSWHAFYYLDFLKQVVEGTTQFELAGAEIGRTTAVQLGIEDGPLSEVLPKLVDLLAHELTGPPTSPRRSRILAHLAPPGLLELWDKANVLPLAPMVEIVRTLTRTSLGVESDPQQLALQTIRVGISDLVNEFVAMAAHNIIHGGFTFRESRANLGALDRDKVNILLHGHIPVIPSVIAELGNDPELQAYAREKGASGINLLGVCCSGNELFARYGLPLAGNFSQQELFIMTGAVDAYVVEQQCVLPTLVQIAQNFHTLVISTDPNATVPGSEHIPVDFGRAYDQGRDIIRKAIDNFGNRLADDVSIPDSSQPISGSFDLRTFSEKIGVDAMVEAIATGKVKGIVAMAACNNPRIKHNYGIATVAQELMKEDILLLATGCAAPGLATSGLMSTEVLGAPFVGEGLRSFCRAHGVPPVLMFGSCISNCQIFYLAKLMAGKLGCELRDLPLAASAPEWMNEKLFPIATYLLAAGIMMHIGPPPPIMGSERAISIFTDDVRELFGGILVVQPDPVRASAEIAKHVKERRERLLASISSASGPED